jgi:O-succinylbenzoic acid--CoA ligase
MFQTNIKQQSILIEGILYSRTAILQARDEKEAFRHSLFVFLQEWFNDSPYIQVQTSGSTGTPKQMLVQKEKMMQSAFLTCSFLQLKAGDRALLCMSLDYIAGKMLVVRAIVAGLNLQLSSPSGHPLHDSQSPLDFAAMIPMQVYNSLQIPAEKKRLAQIKHLIIGGGAVDKDLAQQLQTMPHAVWSTYAMTETLSHIALRRINGADASDYYTPFNHIHLSLSAENTLVIDAPLVCDQTLTTNDIAELLPDGRFRILGRKDNVINSGGVKIQIEQVEELLSAVISVPFAVTAVSHPKFGEMLVLLVTDTINTEMINKVLPTYWQPKQILITSYIPQTGSGKPDRAAIREMAKEIFEK